MPPRAARLKPELLKSRALLQNADGARLCLQDQPQRVEMETRGVSNHPAPAARRQVLRLGFALAALRELSVDSVDFISGLTIPLT